MELHKEVIKKKEFHNKDTWFKHYMRERYI